MGGRANLEERSIFTNRDAYGLTQTGTARRNPPPQSSPTRGEERAATNVSAHESLACFLVKRVLKFVHRGAKFLRGPELLHELHGRAHAGERRDV